MRNDKNIILHIMLHLYLFYFGFSESIMSDMKVRAKSSLELEVKYKCKNVGCRKSFKYRETLRRHIIK